jgi:hypothetical protein
MKPNPLKSGLWQGLSLLISILTFSLILLNRSPNFLRPLSMSLRTGFGLVIPATALVVYLAFRLPGRVGELASLTITLSLFAMPLAGLWASGQSQSTLLSGLIPLSDAKDYYLDALSLLNGHDFSVFSGRRPLFPGLLTVLLALTDRDLMAALAILTAITGLACYLTAREIQRTHGAEVGVFVLLIVFLFYRLHAGISMSENLGVALGTIGFGLLWRGAAQRNLGTIWLGLLTTTLAMNARAGAFFMLPLLILWATWLMRRSAQRISWRALVISASAVVLGFIFNLVLTRSLAVPTGVPFANFSYTLYGLASGGRSWHYVFEANPELLTLQEPEQSTRIYQMAFELIREDPWQMLWGALFNWKMLFSNTWYNVFSYVSGENAAVTVGVRWSLYGLCILGIIAWVINRNDPVQSLVMLSVFGVFVSVPFLPPTDAYRMRPYAASIVVMGCLPAMGLSLVLRRWSPPGLDQTRIDMPPLTAQFCTLLILVTLIGPLLIKATTQPLLLVADDCAPEQDALVIRYDQGTFVNLHRQSEPFLDWMPDYHIGLFRANSHAHPDVNLIAWANSIEPLHTIFLTLDLRSNRKVMILAPTDLLPETGSTVQICGKFDSDPDLSPYDIFYAETVQNLSP